MNRTLPCWPLALLLLAGCNNNGADVSSLDVGATIPLTSSAFQQGQPIPKPYAKAGDNRSPPLAWSDVPKDVKSFALICEDPDAPGGTFVHWVIWNIPGAARELPEGTPTDESMRDGTRQGKNGSGGVGYTGPDPPSGLHHYFFKLYALDTKLELPEAATRGDLESAMRSHVLGHGQLMGTYQK